jgi:uncharacterized secreted protein with C-terminal beta-propeller domain
VACGGGETHSGGTGGAGNAPGQGPDEPQKPGDPGYFESGNPNPGESSRDGNESGSGGATAAPGAEDGATGDKGAERAIEEADIFKVEGDRLYALSRTGGVSVVDVARRDKLSLLGRYDAEATPFEMYVKDGVIIALYADWGRYVEEGNGKYRWVTSSQVLALDARDPKNIKKLGDFRIPGYIQDSRVVGDVLYAVAHENGYCWDCTANKQVTNVISLNVADPRQISKIDNLRIEDPADYSWKRSIAVNTSRIYVAGPDYSWGEDADASSIQVIDISDPAGDLQLGTSVEVDGQIQSRWQMDEKDGVLRVISQPWQWQNQASPSVQTFQVHSSKELEPLATLPMVLPRPEQLQSVRFDGDRAYAITFERTDPLFVLDLSDPAAPKQVGELEMPGWLYHMQPMGDRLLGLGFEQGNEGGSLQVSLFNVADPTKPEMLSRVNFGGDWSYLGEDQDRIHKSFNIMKDQGLILVPYGSYSWGDEGGWSCGSSESGIQLIDWKDDTLKKRGVAPQRGYARRAFMHEERLFTVSEDAVQTFDITDRDAPKATAEMPLNVNVNKVVRVGDYLARFRTDWYSNDVSLEVVPENDPNAPIPLSHLDLKSALFQEEACGYWYFYQMPMFVDGTRITLVATTGDYYVWNDEAQKSEQKPGRTVVSVIDLANPSRPVVLGKKELPFSFETWGFYGYGWGAASLPNTGAAVVKYGNDVLIQRIKYDHQDWRLPKMTSAYELVDVSDPKNIEHRGTVEGPSGRGTTRMLLDGGVALSTHWEPVAGDPDRVRFFLDRFDVKSGKLLTRINVPGALVKPDPKSDHALFVDFDAHSSTTDVDKCYQQYGGWYDWRDDSSARCYWVTRQLRLAKISDSRASLLDSAALPTGGYSETIALSDSRVFLVNSSDYGYAWSDGGYSETESTTRLIVIGSLAADSLEMKTHELKLTSGWSSAVEAQGTKLLLATSYYDSHLSVVDTADLSAPKVTDKGTLDGWINDLTVDGDRALCALGEEGVQVIELR